MGEYSEECLRAFLKDQGQLFDEPVAETLEEAEAFLEDCMAVVVDSLEEVREYFEESGADVDHMTEEELEEASEVFVLPDGTYLIVEGSAFRQKKNSYDRKDRKATVIELWLFRPPA